MKVEVGIVGAGLAGLSCARRLLEAGVECVLFEGTDRVGGRVATDEFGGYLLDRGFQVLLSSYPEARRQLDLEALAARPFQPGSLVRSGGRFWRVLDPWRAPVRGALTLLAPFVSMADGLRLARLRHAALQPGDESARRDDVDTDAYLRECGFSEPLREAFFRPFFGGVTLDPELRVPAAYFRALFGWFATGEAVLPARGMGAIAAQLAAPLPAGALRLKTPVASVAPDAITLTPEAGGERIACRSVVVATGASAAARLLGDAQAPEWSGTTTLYYGAEHSPVGQPILVLNGEGLRAGPVNHLCVVSDAQPTYAPAGKALVSVSVLGVPAEPDEDLDRAVRAQLAGWYGGEVQAWELLRVDRIPHALPRMRPGPRSSPAATGVHVCGDHITTPSIQGALLSGRETGEALLAAR